MKSEQVSLGVYDVASGRTVFMDVTDFGREQYLTNIAWHPSSAYVYIQVLDRSQKHMRLNQYDAKTGAFVQTLLEEKNERYTEPLTPVVFLKDAGSKTFVYRTNNRDGYFNLYLVNAASGKVVKRLTDVDADVEQIEHFTGSGLYDRDFIEVLRKLDDPTPFLRGIVAELGYKRKEIPYEQPKRRAGKTHNNFYRLYDAAMLSITSYTKVGLRLATFIGGVSAVLSIIVALVYLVMKLIWWYRFPAGMAPMLIGMLFLGSVQIFFIGMVGEYVLSINQRVMKRPLVVEEERLNFEENKENDEI